MRAIQQARKDAGLVVTDRIELTLFAGDELADSLRPHGSWIDEQVLATSSTIEPLGGEAATSTDGLGFSVQVVRQG